MQGAGWVENQNSHSDTDHESKFSVTSGKSGYGALFFLYALNMVYSRAAAKRLTTPFILLTKRLHKVSGFASAR